MARLIRRMAHLHRSFAPDVTHRLLELVNAGPFDPVPGSRDEDRYGRKLPSAGRLLVATSLTSEDNR